MPMFRTMSRGILLLSLLPFAAAQQPSKVAPLVLEERSAAAMAAREIKFSTLCHFTAGPSAGSIRDLAPQPAQAVGTACHDDSGNIGIIIEIHITRARPAPLPTPPPPPPPSTPSIAPSDGTSSAAPGEPPPRPKPGADTPPPPPPPISETPGETVPSKGAASPPEIAPDKSGGEDSATATAIEKSTYGQRVGDWYKQLKQGSIEYNIPQKMVWKVASTVTVVIHGYQAQKTSALPQATGSGALKVSDRMRVKLLSPDHPDEFTITNEDSSDDVRYVPADSTTTWRWQVTPNYPAKGQKLVVQAWVLYPEQEEKYTQELPVYTATLDVDASLVTNAARGFWTDPGNWIKYMLPGGAGFLFLAGLIAWMKKKFEKPQTK